MTRTNRKPPRFLLVPQPPYRTPHNKRTFTPLPVLTRIIDCKHALANADDQNPALDLFDRLGNPIPYGDTPNEKHGDDAEDLAGVEECGN